MPQPGETVEIYQQRHLLASGFVVSVDHKTVTIAGPGGLIDLDTTALRRGLNDGSIIIKRSSTDAFDF